MTGAHGTAEVVSIAIARKTPERTTKDMLAEFLHDITHGKPHDPDGDVLVSERLVLALVAVAEAAQIWGDGISAEMEGGVRLEPSDEESAIIVALSALHDALRSDTNG